MNDSSCLIIGTMIAPKISHGFSILIISSTTHNLSHPTNESLDGEGQKILRSFRLSRLILPVLLGLSAVAFLFYKQFDLAQFKQIQWTTKAFLWIGLSFVLLILRHFSYAFRLRTITKGALTWRKCLEMIVFWEFSSAVTPTSKGGPLVMLFVLTKEKLSAGQTAAAVFYTTICDSGFFVLSLPFFLMFYGPPMLYPGMTSFDDVTLASSVFFASYTMMVTYWLALVFIMLINPASAKKLLHWLGSVSILKRFSGRITRLADEFEAAALEIRRQPWPYHFRIILGTLGAWTCKFFMINCLIIAIVPTTPLDGATQAFIYARLIAMFVIMAFSPTPGGAGLAEIALAGFISDYVPTGIGLVVALLWRGMAYYGYLILGAIIIPIWVRAKFGKPIA